MAGGNWWDSAEVVAPAPAAPAKSASPGFSGYIPGRPKTPSPQTPNQAANDALSVQTKTIDLQNAPLDREAKTESVKTAKLNQAGGLRADYDANPAVKIYNSILPTYSAALTSPPTAAGDYGLVYGVAKVMAADGSAVREGEVASTEQIQSWVDRIKGQYSKQVNGDGTFTDEARKQIRAAMAQKMARLNEAYIQQRVRYKDTADRAGLDPRDVVGDHAGIPFQDDEAKFLGHPVSQADYRGNVIPTAPTGGGLADGPSGQPADPVKGYRFDADAVTALNSYLHNPGATPEGYKSLHDRLAGGGAIVTPEEAARTVAAIKADPNAKFGIDYSKVDAPLEEKARALAEQWDGVGPPRSDTGTVLNEGASAGLSGEAAGVGNAISGVLRGDLNLSENYTTGRNAKDLQIAESRKRLGAAAIPVEIAGGFVSGNPSAISSVVAPALGQTVRAGVKAGATGGALAGYGYGQGAEGSVVGAALGGAGGAALGGALPVAGRLVADRVAGARAMVGADPALSRRIVARAIQNDGNTPAQVGTMLDEAGTRGSPLALADTGDNARALLGSMGRQPGASRTLTRDAIIPRQEGQQERIGAAVLRDLGPTANIRETGDALVAQAKAAAAPLYDKAYAASGASSVKLDDLATRPSFKNALQRAQRLAQEEGKDPTSLGFQLTDQGEVTLDRVPSFETLDYVKRGLDDVVEAYRDGTTGKLNLNGEGRAVNNTLRALTSRIDTINPDYAAARAAYAGPVKLNEAVVRGSKALPKTADDITAEFARMSPNEQEGYRLGLRKAIVDHLETKGDYADKVNALIGTPKKRAALQRVFGDAEGFNNFMATLGDERAMAETYKSVAGNSMTAERAAQDAASGDGGLLDDATGRVLRGVRDGPWATIIDGFGKLRSAGQFGAGQAGERTRERIAALLTETDPTVLRDIILAARNAQMAQTRAAERLGRVTTIAGSQGGRTVGSALAPKGERK